MNSAANTKESQSNEDVEKSNRRRKKKKLYKVKRSSGETQLLTKEDIHKLNEAKRRRHKIKKYLKLTTFVFGIFITLLGAGLIIKDFVKPYKGSSNGLAGDLSDQLAEVASPRLASSEDKQTQSKSLIEDERGQKGKRVKWQEDKWLGEQESKNEKTEYISPKSNQRNKESTDIISIISPTKLSIIQGPEGTITTSDVHFVFDANKPVTFSYMLEGYDSKYSDFLPIRSKSYPNLPDGSYIFHLRANEKFDKITEPIFRTFSIDTTPPDVKIIEGPDGEGDKPVYRLRDIIFRFSANEDATFATYLRGYDKQFSGYTEDTTKSYNNLLDGDYTFQVKAKDKYGNESLEPVIRSFTVDAEAPGVVIIEGPDSIISEKSVTFKFIANEEATFAYWLEGRDSGYLDFVPNNSVTYNELPDGDYVFYLKAKDKSGNVDPAPAKLKFTIDTTSPNTSITRGPKGMSSSSEAKDLIRHSTVSFSFEAGEKASFSYYLE